MLHILYHRNCNDGFCAAWLVHTFRSSPSNYPSLVPLDYDEDGRNVVQNLIPGLTDLDEVWMVDYSVPCDLMDALVTKCQAVGAMLTVCDHHKTALADLKEFVGQPGFYLDNDHSGAMLTARALEALGHTVPSQWFRVVQYVEDRDLWRWQIPLSREVNAYLGTVPRDLLAWNELMGSFDQSYEKIVHMGTGVLRSIASDVALACHHIITGVLFTDQGLPLSVGAVGAYAHQSEIGEALRERLFDICATLSVNLVTEKVKCSLRAGKSGVDVSAIAKANGGGGHAAAAGCEFPSLTDAWASLGLTGPAT